MSVTASNIRGLLQDTPDELVPSVLLRDVLQRLEFPRSHGAGADVPNPALLDNIVQRLHDLFPRGIAVQAVDLQDIDVCAEALDALLHSIEDMFAAESNLIDHLAIVGRDCCDAE